MEDYEERNETTEQSRILNNMTAPNHITGEELFYRFIL
jgi:hypothetical protein